MIERHLQTLRIEDPGAEEPAATRERLRDKFPGGTARRMTQLGLLLGSVLEDIAPNISDPIVYASTYAENRALEDYLASFPAASPALFQTSVHPSALQQFLISRRQPVHQVFPLTGGSQLVAHAVQTAFLAPGARAVLCGGEERGTWARLRVIGRTETFAFAAVLTTEPSGALATLRLGRADAAEGALTLSDFFSALRERRPIDQAAAPGLILSLRWHHVN